MVDQVGNGALAGGLRLDGEGGERDHGQAAVLDLLGLHLLEVALF